MGTDLFIITRPFRPDILFTKSRDRLYLYFVLPAAPPDSPLPLGSSHHFTVTMTESVTPGVKRKRSRTQSLPPPELPRLVAEQHVPISHISACSRSWIHPSTRPGGCKYSSTLRRAF